MRRNGSTGLWRMVSLTALASTLLLLFGFGYSVKDMLWPQGEAYEGERPSAVPEVSATLGASKEIRITAIGDSLTKGTGDATGEGYVKQVVRLLEEKFKVPVKLNNNLAVNGLRADQLVERLKTDKGYRFSLSQSNLILFTIGGNDLFQIAAGQPASQATGDFDLGNLKSELPEGIERLKQVVEQLYEINPDAQVVYIGLYNPFYDLKDLREGSLEVQKWNNQAYELVHRYPNMTLIPTFDLFENTIGTYLSSDHFHPNHEGYGQIAIRITQSLE
ncbi:GDSL-type esterase/lipase family protein [Paenibacillus nasutitermitis]|uniref:Lipase/acylhydrolase n=1 Tax=Paenibacillus nasutitermitis TaxID=1652958 RepID=A0A917DSK1_9BACL|nr:GDSL-type esterase/lipase family protein [Paenibacillus nasutitermitis]GGD64710.1 lipase/acylhydrolase [Paenibacillus nasutitermitis]